MTFGYLVVLHLLLLTLYHSSKGLTCDTIYESPARDILYCHSSEQYNFTIENIFKYEVKVHCLSHDIDLTELSYRVYKTVKFISNGCNLVDRLQKLFTQWEITETEVWHFQRFSTVDFVLNRQQFENLNVSSIDDFRMESSNVISVEPDTFYDFTNLEYISLYSNKIKILPDLFKYSKSLRSMNIADNELDTLPDEFTAPSLLYLQLWNNNLTSIDELFFTNATQLKVLDLNRNKLDFLPEKLLYPLVNLEEIGLEENSFENVPDDFFKMNKRLIEVRMPISETSEKTEKITCVNTTSRTGQEMTFYCPLLEEYNLTVNVKFNKEVNVLCLVENIKLTAMNVSIGEIEEFGSKNCNLLDQFHQVFTKWNITGTKIWYIRNSSINDFVLTKRQFGTIDVSSVEKVHIQYSNIIGIEPDTFDHFTKLKLINLIGNKIRNLPDLFKYSKSLRLMEFASNALESLPEEFTAPSLKSLLLWMNNLTVIDEFFFTNATKINILELSKNKIRLLPEKLLYPLVDLEQISLSENLFEKIPKNFFTKNKRLFEIRLSYLNMTEISEDIFYGLSNLNIVMLNLNFFETLPEKIFANLSNIHELYLNDNRLVFLPDNIFKDLEQLEFLDLSKNRLSTWTYKHSKNLINLKTLNLSRNNFVKINSNTFYGLTKLKVLHLSRNQISYIDSSVLNSLELQILDLSYNNLTNDNDSPISFVDGTPSITTLLLHHNAFEMVLNNVGFKISHLDMSYNNIGQIDISDFLFQCKTVLLNNNKIEKIDFRRANSTMIWNESDGPPVSININNNPINCGCDVYDLLQYYDRTYENKRLLKKFSLEGNLRCEKPASMAGRNVSNITSNKFNCDYTKVYKCPERCDCKMYPKFQSFNVSCNDLEFQVPPVIPEFTPINYRHPYSGDLFSITRLVVNLENNSISNFTERDSSYVNVSELYLSNNKLNLVNWLPPKLEILQLDDNKLGNLGYAAISILNDSTTLKQLTLHNNTWNCNCKLVNFTKLMKFKYFKILYEDRVLCSDGRKVMQMSEGTLCVFENQAAVIAIASCLFLFLIMIGVALVLYYKYEYHVKVWLYSKPLFMRFVTEDELDKDKIYDAFLSYSNKDHEFVVNELLSELEQGPNPYKVCVHFRDWMVGEFITKQIVDSVENSRRTIIVLSPYFLQSEWATMEFRTAHVQAMREGRHRLIVILHGDLDPNAVEDDELRTYLTTNTYVKWGDPWFWKKLKYVLPHKKGENNNNNNNNTRKKLKNKKMENIMVAIDKMDLINSPATPNLVTPPAGSMDPLLLKSNALTFKANPNQETPPAESGLVISTTS